MNKRILDGVALWKSDKIARIKPEWIRAEYANWIPLALANGVFEADTRRIWSIIYSYNRPDISSEDTDSIKREFFRVGLTFYWLDEETGKVWGYFTGIEKQGRLPPKSRLDNKHEEVGPIPPAEALRNYIELTSSKALDSSVASQWLANGSLGSGSGSGSGLGLGSGTGTHVNPAPSALGVCEEIVTLWNSNRGPLPEVQKLTEDRRLKIKTRLQSDPEFLKTFTGAVQKAVQTPFLCGNGNYKWKADFDWMVENDTNAIRVLEGKYDHGKGALTDAEQRTVNNLKASGLIQ